MAGYEIRTPFGTSYVIADAGIVLAHDHCSRRLLPSWVKKRWRVTGAWIGRGCTLGYVNLPQLLKKSPEELLFKNGNPRYGLTDVFNDVCRMHGNLQRHGIKSIRKLAP